MTAVHFSARMRWHSDDIRPADVLEDTFLALERAWRDAAQADEIRWFAREHMLRLKPIMGGSTATATANDLLKLVLNATTIANLAQNASSAPITTIDFALYTATPGFGGDMTTNEIAYTSYARASVARSAGALVVSGNAASPASNISFPVGTGGSATARFVACGYPGGGATKILFFGVASPNVLCGSGVTPILTTATTMTLT